MSDYTPTTENVRQTFAYIQAGLDDDDGYPFVMHVHVEAFDRWLAAHDAEVAAKALEEAAVGIFVSPAEIDPGKRAAFHRGADAVYDALRARAEAYLREETE